MSIYEKDTLKVKNKTCANKVENNSPIKVRGLKEAYDLAQVIKHLMIDKKLTYYVKSNSTQCEDGRSRTVEDLTVVANSYGIKITFEEAQKAVESLYAGYLMHDYYYTVKKEVHDPRNLQTTAKTLRNALGKHNIKNPNYVKPEQDQGNSD